MNYLRIYFLLIILSFISNAYSNNPREDYLKKDLQTRTFDKSEWQDLTKDLDFSDSREIRKPEKEEPKKRQKSVENTGFFKFLAILIAIALAVLVILHLMGTENLFAPKNKKIKTTSTEINIEDIEDNIHETELEGFIYQAIQNGDFPMAIRLYYMEIIKKLSLIKAIKWKKDKTNGEYLKELQGSKFHSSFKELTSIFERSWFGDAKINEVNFKKIEPKFQALMNRLSQVSSTTIIPNN
ncbi:MAG: hypothetical protein NXI23_04190 [Bacteroidetes bacterium]|nr:hypothetical protein [Bacteroidota bacterium]MDF1865248.1 hypothetical protein [Saprospiraceae bacterium]